MSKMCWMCDGDDPTCPCQFVPRDEPEGESAGVDEITKQFSFRNAPLVNSEMWLCWDASRDLDVPGVPGVPVTANCVTAAGLAMAQRICREQTMRLVVCRAASLADGCEWRDLERWEVTFTIKPERMKTYAKIQPPAPRKSFLDSIFCWVAGHDVKWIEAMDGERELIKDRVSLKRAPCSYCGCVPRGPLADRSVFVRAWLYVRESLAKWLAKRLGSYDVSEGD